MAALAAAAVEAERKHVARGAPLRLGALALWVGGGWDEGSGEGRRALGVTTFFLHAVTASCVSSSLLVSIVLILPSLT